MSKKHAALATFFLEGYQKAAFMTVAEVAAQLRVSPATVIRFATALGYRGYPALRRHLHEIVQEDLDGTNLFANHLRERDPNVLHSIVRRETDSLTRLLNEQPIAELERAATAVAKAARVFVVGVRSASSLAQYFGYHLGKIRDEVVTITSGGSAMLDRCATMGASDVMLAVAFPRYPRETLELAELASRHRALVVAMTDSVLSPLAKLADVTISVHHAVIAHLDMFSAPQALLAALLVLTSERDQPRTEKSLRRFEEIAGWQRTFHIDA